MVYLHFITYEIILKSMTIFIANLFDDLKIETRLPQKEQDIRAINAINAMNEHREPLSPIRVKY